MHLVQNSTVFVITLEKKYIDYVRDYECTAFFTSLSFEA
jgi:hypothetical protein